MHGPHVYDVELVDWDDDDAPLATVPGVPAPSREAACDNPAVTAKLGTLRADYPNAGVGRVVRLDAR
jgi:hypothetical protein